MGKYPIYNPHVKLLSQRSDTPVRARFKTYPHISRWGGCSSAILTRVISAGTFRRRASALVRVATQCTNIDGDSADKAADNHYVAESVMPAAHRSHQQHRAADNEGRESDCTREPLEVAAEATSHGFQTRKSAQIAFGDTSEDASRVAGRINYQALQFARELGCRFLYLRR